MTRGWNRRTIAIRPPTPRERKRVIADVLPPPLSALLAHENPRSRNFLPVARALVQERRDPRSPRAPEDVRRGFKRAGQGRGDDKVERREGPAAARPTREVLLQGFRLVNSNLGQPSIIQTVLRARGVGLAQQTVVGASCVGRDVVGSLCMPNEMNFLGTVSQE